MSEPVTLTDAEQAAIRKSLREWFCESHMQQTVKQIIADRTADLTAENVKLLRWKAEAMTVITEWDRVHEALGKPGRLGESMAAASLAEIERRAADQEQRLADAKADGWDAAVDRLRTVGYLTKAANPYRRTR